MARRFKTGSGDKLVKAQDKGNNFKVQAEKDCQKAKSKEVKKKKEAGIVNGDWWADCR